MKLKIKKEKEVDKKGKPKKLLLDIEADLSQEDQELIKKYGSSYPYIYTAGIKAYYDGAEEQFKRVKHKLWDPFKGGELGEFKLTASVDSGLHLEDIQRFEDAVIQAVAARMSYLRSLNAWEGQSEQEI